MIHKRQGPVGMPAAAQVGLLLLLLLLLPSCIPFPACDWTDSSSALNTNQQQGFHCIRGRACAQAHVFPSPVASSNAGEPVFFSPNKIINYFSATLAKSDAAPGGHTAVNIHSSCVGNLCQNKNIKMFFFSPLTFKVTLITDSLTQHNANPATITLHTNGRVNCRRHWQQPIISQGTLRAPWVCRAKFDFPASVHNNTSEIME